jgi:hypothetical protein
MSERPEPSSYDRQAHAEIERWKQPSNSLVRRAARLASRPLEAGVQVVLDISPLGAAVRGVVALLNDGATYTVSDQRIYERFRERGHDVTTEKDIARLSLDDVDAVVGYLSTKYMSMAGTSGAATGATGTINPVAGLASIAVDLPATIGMACRAIAEYGTFYGFDPKRSQGERAYVLWVLEAASSPEDASKTAAMAELTRLAAMLEKGASWAELNRLASVNVVQRIAKHLPGRLTKRKLANAVPVLGAAVGGGFNAHYLNKVTTAAYHCYRERFLLRAHGEDWA